MEYAMRRYVPTTFLRYIGIALVVAGLSIPFTAAANGPSAQGFTEFGPGDSVQPRTTQTAKSMTRTMVASYNIPGFVP
jgi:hypothetical protein